MVPLNKGGTEISEQQFRQLFTTTENSKQQPTATKTQPTTTVTKHQQTKKTPQKTLKLRSLPRKTQNKRQKGLLDCCVACVCALRNIGDPFSKLDKPTSEELASLKNTRIKNIRQDIYERKIAGDN
jgi:hypothetical protein